MRVRAAGGVPFRKAPGGPEVLLVHRPRYDDWTFPKGKLEGDESWDQAARREVLEEAGLRCVPVERLVSVDYVDHRGRPKKVRYWSMTVIRDEGFAPNDECDERRWVGVDDARDLLTYERDRHVLADFVARHS